MRTLTNSIAPALLAALLFAAGLTAQTPPRPVVGGDVSPDGKEPVAIPFPVELRRENIVSPRGSNQGCCVHTSAHHIALWQSIPQWKEFPAWVQSKGIPGGANPGLFKQRTTAICKERGLPEPAYIQVTGGKNVVDMIKLALRTGRKVGATYCYSPTGRYGGARIAHMLNVVHCTDQWVAVLDNNYIDKLEWIPADQFLPVLAGRSGQDGWIIVALNPGPPPALKTKLP